MPQDQQSLVASAGSQLLATRRFLVYFAWQPVTASIVATIPVATRRDGINTGIVAVPLHGASDALVTQVADAVTLTQGR